MALINVDSALQRICRDMQKTALRHGIEILSYKRNRGVAVIRVHEDRYQVCERGYHEEEWQVNGKELAKLLKTLFKREFPRSRKVRIYSLPGVHAMARELKRL